MALESALGITILVIALSVLMEIVNTVYASDRMERAARAAARALALDANADACAAIRRELHLADEFDCGAAWTLTIDHGVSPSTLPATLDAAAQTGAGSLVLVRIGWTHDGWALPGFGSDDEHQELGAVTQIAMGLARSE